MKCSIHNSIFLFILLLALLNKYSISQNIAIDKEDTSVAKNKVNLQVVKIEEIPNLIKPPQSGFTILNLWATWCPPCVKEIPHFIQFYQKHKKDNIKLILLSIEGKDSEEDTLKPFLQKNPIPFRVYLLEKGTPEELEKVLKTTISGALPVTIIYGNDGKVIKKFEGPITSKDLEKATNIPTSH